MKHILIILALFISLASCKKEEKAPTPTSSTPTPTPTPTATGDTVYFSIAFECPSPNFFNYRYDTTNTRVLVNGQKISFASMSPLIGLPHLAYNYVTNTNDTAEDGLEQFDNYFRGTQNVLLLMNSGDSLTLEIDSLMYTGANDVHGGNIAIGVAGNTAIQPPLSSPTSAPLIWTVDNSTFAGRYLGVGEVNSHGGGSGQKQWYVGTSYRYTWVKP